MSEENRKQSMPYGLWPSPITAAAVSQQVRLNGVQWIPGTDGLVWLEGRSGKGTLVEKHPRQARRDLTTDLSVKGLVGYGGGEFGLGTQHVYYSDSNGALYCQPLEFGSAFPLMPLLGAAASPQPSPDGKWVLFVFSDGKTDLLGIVDSRAATWPQKLASGADFYMQPAWHPDGKSIAWVEWNHPNMPWDGTWLKMASLEGATPVIKEEASLAGGLDHPVSQPQFSPDGRWLSYIDSGPEWDRLVLIDLQSMKDQVLWEGEQNHFALPPWVQGMRSYGWSHTSRHLYVIQNYGGFADLWQVHCPDGRREKIDTTPYTWLTHLSVSTVSDQVAFIVSAAGIPDRVVCWDGRDLNVLARSTAENLPPEVLPRPRILAWPAPDGTRVEGIYYPPCSPTFSGEGLPPAIVNIHGGPTSQATSSFSAEMAYFTSRGYAWLEVNYRGSSGYGRKYQQAQRQRWGVVDVEDAAGAAKALVEQNLASAGHLVIYGGSAGGYTVLNTLIQHPGLFKAGICRYGVSNLFSLEMDTHKFEQHYNASLVGVLPGDSGRFYERSPVFHADKIRDALAIFQGSEDKIVPPDQSQQIVERLRSQGIPHLYRLYEGEGHGFRKSETIADYLEQVERFLQVHVLFAP